MRMSMFTKDPRTGKMMIFRSSPKVFLHFHPSFLHIRFDFSSEDCTDLGLIGGGVQITLEHFFTAAAEVGVIEDIGGIAPRCLFVGLPDQELMNHNLTAGFFLEDAAIQQGTWPPEGIMRESLWER